MRASLCIMIFKEFRSRAMEQVKPCIKVHGVASIDFQSKATAQSEVKNSTAGLEAPNVAMDTR